VSGWRITSVCRWLLVAVYTASLPWLILLWDAATSYLGHYALLLPWLVVLAMVLAITGKLVLDHAGRGQWGYLLAACLPAMALLTWVTFPAERLHLPEYVLMAVLVTRALGPRCPRPFFWTVLVCLLLGCVDEIMQGLIPDRFFDVQDLVVNGMAALAGMLALRALGMGEKDVGPGPVCLRISGVLAFLQIGFLVALLARAQAALVSSGEGLGWLTFWQAAALLAWAVASGVVACWKSDGALRAAMLSVSVAQALMATGTLLGLPFV